MRQRSRGSGDSRSSRNFRLRVWRGFRALPYSILEPQSPKPGSFVVAQDAIEKLRDGPGDGPANH